jgi:hypothetical protein
MGTADQSTARTTSAHQLFDRRRVMVMAGRAVGVAGAGALVGTIIGAPDADAATTGGTFDATARGFYTQYAHGRWKAMEAKFDPNVLLTVPAQGFLNPGTYGGPAAVGAYFKGVAATGLTLTLDSMSGFAAYSLGVHHGVLPSGQNCDSVLMLRFTPAGQADEVTLFGFAGA